MLLVLLFVVHVLIALSLIGVVMLQKSEGGALGMGGGGGMSGFMTGRSTANLLTRTTAVLAVLFFGTSIALVMLSNAGRAPQSIVDQGPSTPLIPSAPVPALPGAPPPTLPTAPAAPAAPTTPPSPSAPLAR